MTLRLNFEIRDRQVRAALARSPGVVRRRAVRGLERGAIEVAREGKRRAPKAESTLTNSIGHRFTGPMTIEVGPTVRHGDVMEHGREPGGPMPPIEPLIDWIRTRRISPYDEAMDERDLAFVIARSIQQHGTPAQPYMGPAIDAKRDRVTELVRAGVRDGIKEIGL